MVSSGRHLSMLRSYTAADLLTIGNAACGTIAIFLCLDYVASGERRFLWSAFVLLAAALICDLLDGYVARLDRGRQSRLGADLDAGCNSCNALKTTRTVTHEAHFCFDCGKSFLVTAAPAYSPVTT